MRARGASWAGLLGRVPRSVVGASAAAVLVALGVTVGWLRAPQEAVPAVGPRPAEARPAPPAPAPAPAPPAVNAETPPAFLDPGKAGNYAYSRGDYEGALRHYEDAIAKNPDDAEAHSNLGQVLVRLNRTAEAIPHFERAIGLIPDRWAYHFNLAVALGRLGQWERAVAEYRVAAALFPDDYVTQFNLGNALHRLGDEAGAVVAYRRAIELAPEEGSFYVALGLSYERLGRTAEALAAYERAVDLGRDAPDAPLVRARMEQLRRAAQGKGAPGRPAGSPP